MPDFLASARSRLADLGDWSRKRLPLAQRVPRLAKLIEIAARVGYGARGFVYFSVGALMLGAAIGLAGDAVGTFGAIGWLAQQPLGRVWMVLLALGLTAFVQWRILQAVFDADHEGTSREGIGRRMSQGFSGLAYGVMAVTAFRFIADLPEDPQTKAVVDSREHAATVMALPFGHWLLVGAGLALAVTGLMTATRGLREDFTEYLACSEKLCGRVAPLARAGYVARGLAYLPLAGLMIVAGLRSKASEVAGFDAALEAVERQPFGAWVLGAASLGFLAFGAFSFVEARYRKIRPARALKAF